MPRLMRTATTSVIGWIATSLAAPAAEPAAPSPIVFRDVAAEAGVRFRFGAGSRGRQDLPEIMGGGVAILDADGDGWLDIYLCNGGPIGGGTRRPAVSLLPQRRRRDVRGCDRSRARPRAELRDGRGGGRL